MATEPIWRIPTSPTSANSVINIIRKIVTTIIVILCLAVLIETVWQEVGRCRRLRAQRLVILGVSICLQPTDIGWMMALTVLVAVAYAPTIPLMWAMFADVADYSEWKTGRRFTGIVFATIGFALKSGLSTGRIRPICGSWLGVLPFGEAATPKRQRLSSYPDNLRGGTFWHVYRCY